MRSDDVPGARIAAERRQLAAKTLAPADGMPALTQVARRDQLTAGGEFAGNGGNCFAFYFRHICKRYDPAVAAAPLRYAMREARAHAACSIGKHGHLTAFLFQHVGEGKVALLHYRNDV